MMHDAKALDSVIAERVNLAAGVVTANFRQDGACVKSTVKGERIDTGRTKLGSIVGAGTFIGIHADLMPGTKVGAHAVVGPSTIVRCDVADRTLYYAQQHYVTQPLSTPVDER